MIHTQKRAKPANTHAPTMHGCCSNQNPRGGGDKRATHYFIATGRPEKMCSMSGLAARQGARRRCAPCLVWRRGRAQRHMFTACR